MLQDYIFVWVNWQETSVDLAPRPLRWSTQTAGFAMGVFCGVVLWNIFINLMLVLVLLTIFCFNAPLIT